MMKGAVWSTSFNTRLECERADSMRVWSGGERIACSKRQTGPSTLTIPNVTHVDRLVLKGERSWRMLLEDAPLEDARGGRSGRMLLEDAPGG